MSGGILPVVTVNAFAKFPLSGIETQIGLSYYILRHMCLWFNSCWKMD